MNYNDNDQSKSELFMHIQAVLNSFNGIAVKDQMIPWADRYVNQEDDQRLLNKPMLKLNFNESFKNKRAGNSGVKTFHNT